MKRLRTIGGVFVCLAVEQLSTSDQARPRRQIARPSPSASRFWARRYGWTCDSFVLWGGMNHEEMIDLGETFIKAQGPIRKFVSGTQPPDMI